MDSNPKEKLRKKNESLQILPRLYADICKSKPSSYYDYQNFEVNWKDPANYSIIKEIGCGGYSEVFECVKESTEIEGEINCIIKILKPTDELSVKREIKVLENVRGGPSIVKYTEAVKDEDDDTLCLVFENTGMINLFEVREKLTPEDIKIFMFKIFEAMDYAHSKGVMHRDIKMHNILVDLETKGLQIIDWGLSEFYHPNYAYNTKVSTKSYRAPELVADYPYYDYSLDIWCIGVLFAELLLNKFPFINSIDTKDHMNKLLKRRSLVKEVKNRNSNTNNLSFEAYIKLCGYKEFKDFLERYSIKTPSNIKESYKKCPPLDFRTKFSESRIDFLDDQVIDLLENLLRIDKQERLTAKEAMEHPYFDTIFKNE